MSKYFSELQRLYFLPGQPAGAVAAFDLLGTDGKARCMVINFERSSDWPQVNNLFQAVQEELDLPAPAISVSGNKGYGLWFSLSEAIENTEVCAFMNGLRERYLNEIPVAHLGLRPEMNDAAPMILPAASHTSTGKWSAFIDPTLGSMFIDEPWLEMAPNRDKQADILSGLQSIQPDELQRAIAVLHAPETIETLPASAPAMDQTSKTHGEEKLNLGRSYSDPTSFLLAVMNDGSISAEHRIKAAKALLPYFTPAKQI